jgi:hypothetical protein
MENNPTSIEKLIERAEAYVKTSFELSKYTALDTAADVFSTLAARLTIWLFVTLFSLFINIGIALWIGEELGQLYYGFFVVAGFYIIVAWVLYIFRKKWLKVPMSNFIIRRTLKEKLI